MNYKYLSWFLAILAFLTHIFGVMNLIYLIISIIFFFIGIFLAIYSFGGDPDTWRNEMEIFIRTPDNPLEPQGQRLGLNLAGDQKPIVLIQPNIKIQTESPKHKKHKQQHHGHTESSGGGHKKSFIDSGIDLLFKKHGKHGIKEGYHLDTKDPTIKKIQHTEEHKKWKPFENIKIYGEKCKNKIINQDLSKENIQIGEDCTVRSTNSSDPLTSTTETSTSTQSLYNTTPYKYSITIESDAHLLDEHGSPKKKLKAMLSGNKKIDQLLHTFIDYIIRDFIDSWFCSLSDNKEFGDFRVRNCMEDSIKNICARIKNTHWLPLLTTKCVEHIAAHTKFYRLAVQAIKLEDERSKTESITPNRRGKKTQHKRNKSDTDLNWHFGASTATQKNVANSKFYTAGAPEEKVLTDPEENLINAFFNQSELFREECTDDIALENYLTRVTETILYFTIPEEDFACIPLRTFLSTLLANVVFKPFLKLIADPDFINLQVAKMIPKDPPPVEYFLKALRQSKDLSELRACRQLITKEMNAKYKDSSAHAEVNSLKYAQNLIDLRINQLQNIHQKLKGVPDEFDAHGNSSTPLTAAKLPILTLDELLFKELARSYFLDYLSDVNLQKYVIFYLTADEWKSMAKHSIVELQSHRSKSSKEEINCNLKDKAQNIYQEYLQPSSHNYLTVDQGLIEALSIKLKNPNIVPESNWFDSICKFVYEKLKNEEIFLTKFYQSLSYKKLLLELEVDGISQYHHEPSLFLDNFTEFLEHSSNISGGGGSDSNSGDINFDEDMLDLVVNTNQHQQQKQTNSDFAKSELITKSPPDLLEVINFKHSRSHSDCTGANKTIFCDLTDSDSTTISDNNLQQNSSNDLHGGLQTTATTNERATSAPTQRTNATIVPKICLDGRPKLTAKIINTAILCDGQYAVYAVHVVVIEDNQEKSWHIYRRYSKFYELKKMLVKKYPNVAKLPFPAKKAFQNTQRSVLEHRMVLLNEFLRFLCEWAENNVELMVNLRDFLEPDTDDKKINGGAVIRTIETIVNPLKTGMRTIKNMPDTLVGGFSRILLGKGPLKEQSFLEINLEQCEYPALNSAIHLLDEVFDLQTRSQWLRRGIINRVLGAPWVSQTANKKIIHHAKSLIELERIDQILTTLLNSLWPDGKSFRKSQPREDNTKLRTRVAAQMSLFALLFDDLKRVVGSETTRHGLLNFFEMWQHEKLNLRLALILFNDVLTTVYRIDSMTAHVTTKSN